MYQTKLELVWYLSLHYKMPDLYELEDPGFLLPLPLTYYMTLGISLISFGLVPPSIECAYIFYLLTSGKW